MLHIYKLKIFSVSFLFKFFADSTPPTTNNKAGSEDDKAVLLATIFGILGAIILVLIVVLVLKNLNKRSKVNVQPTNGAA